MTNQNHTVFLEHKDTKQVKAYQTVGHRDAALRRMKNPYEWVALPTKKRKKP